jgi:hypothetical protein
VSLLIGLHGGGVFISSKFLKRRKKYPIVIIDQSRVPTNISSLPIGAVALVVIFFLLQIKRVNNPDNLSLKERILQLDLIGASIIVPTIVMFLLALQWGGSTYPWKDAKIIGLFCGAGVLFCIFIFSQLKLGDKATLPPRLFKDRNILCAYMFAFFFGSGFFVLIFYMAIYFQSVKGSTATHAGIQLLPLLIATVLSSIATGGLITAIGYYVPIQIVCMILFSVGSGLLTTFDLHTSTAKWFGYQVIAGLGIGVGFQASVLIVQTVLPLADVPVATACVSFFQSLGGALFIAVAQSLFQHGLTDNIARGAPELDPQLFLRSGATQIRSILKELHAEDRLDVVLQGYVDGLTHTFWITTACAIAALFVCFGLEWKNIKHGDSQGSGKKKVGDEESGSGSVKEEIVDEKEKVGSGMAGPGVAAGNAEEASLKEKPLAA